MTEQYTNILVERRGRVGLVTLNRPEALNALNKACLLYTSPSPRDLSTSRMPSSA